MWATPALIAILAAARAHACGIHFGPPKRFWDEHTQCLEEVVVLEHALAMGQAYGAGRARPSLGDDLGAKDSLDRCRFVRRFLFERLEPRRTRDTPCFHHGGGVDCGGLRRR